MDRLPLTGVILAGGLSRRLGRDKALLSLGGEPLALRVAALLQPLVQELWLSTNRPLAHAGLGLPLVTDLVPSQGPLGGLLTALFFSPTPWVLAASVDSPFLQPRLLEAMCRRAAKTSRPAVLAESARELETFPGLFHVRLRPRLEEYLHQGERRVRPFLQACRPEILSREETARLDPEGLSFLNLNTPGDLTAASLRFLKKEREEGKARRRPG